MTVVFPPELKHAGESFLCVRTEKSSARQRLLIYALFFPLLTGALQRNADTECLSHSPDTLGDRGGWGGSKGGLGAQEGGGGGKQVHIQPVLKDILILTSGAHCH